MSDQLASYVRTLWPTLVGIVTGVIVAALAKHLGIEIDSTVAMGATSAVMIALVYGLGRWLEMRRSPLARSAGRWLLSLGLRVGPPTYQDRPGSGPLGRRLPPRS
ncbi:MAG: hypothetical protein HOV79_00435 [Hamadaea sp.]|nr:hypothetical protein [Hamadaea sp.]